MSFLLRTGLLVGALALTGCGNEVVLENTGGGSSSSTKSSTGTQGTSTSTATTMSSTSTGQPPACAGLSEPECLGAFPACAPLYDDTCCPTCNPGPCADCIHVEFYACEPANEICFTGQPLECGFASKETCSGIPASCSEPFCGANAGCVEACAPDASGQCSSFECHPVTAGSCTSFCDGIPPLCPPGTTPEQDGGCYTGFCIPDQVCN